MRRSKAAFLTFSLALAACVPLSVLTAGLRDQSDAAEKERAAGHVGRAAAVKCQAALLRAAEETERLPRVGGLVSRRSADEINLRAQGDCTHDLGTADRDLLRRDLGVRDAGGQEGGGPCDLRQGADRGEPTASPRG